MSFIRSHITFESNVFRTSVPHYSSDIITLSRVNCYEIKIISRGAIMYEIYAKLRDEKGVKDATVAKATGIGKSTFTDWRNGRSAPKDEKLQKIADYFGVSPYYIRTGKQPKVITIEKPDFRKLERLGFESDEEYYEYKESQFITAQIFANRDLRALFDAARGCKPEDLKMASDLLIRLRGTNPDG